MQSPLVSADWLLEHEADPRVKVVDVRWYLAGKRGQDEYARGHIPGAVFVDLDRDLAAEKGSGPGRHPLPSADAFAATLSRIGVTAESLVVGYDDAGGAIAARLWWLLRYFGHGGGRVLDGGLDAYVARGYPLSTEVPVVSPAPPLALCPGGARVIDKAGISRFPASAVILDARSADRYEGRSEPIDARPGHIPGARSAPFAGNLIEHDVAGRSVKAFLSREALERRYRELGALDAQTLICYCGSGVTACHDLLALAQIGRPDAILYEGSWSDWAADSSLPAALGPTP
jgi:thiosulfate/3-mercaptopyruvate sulfurtransferase